MEPVGMARRPPEQKDTLRSCFKGQTNDFIVFASFRLTSAAYKSENQPRSYLHSQTV